MLNANSRNRLPLSIKSLPIRKNGFTVIEILAVTAIAAITTALTASYLRSLENPLESSTREMTGLFKLARARAVSSTSAYQILPTSSNQIVAQYANTCDDTVWTNDVQLGLELDDPISVTTGWSVCINSRGTVSTMPTSDIIINSSADSGGSAELVVYIGGLVEAEYTYSDSP